MAHQAWGALRLIQLEGPEAGFGPAESGPCDMLWIPPGNRPAGVCRQHAFTPPPTRACVPAKSSGEEGSGGLPEGQGPAAGQAGPRAGGPGVKSWDREEQKVLVLRGHRGHQGRGDGLWLPGPGSCLDLI